VVGDEGLEEHAPGNTPVCHSERMRSGSGAGDRGRGRRLDARLEDHDARHATDPFELRDDAGPVGVAEVRGRQRDDSACTRSDGTVSENSRSRTAAA